MSLSQDAMHDVVIVGGGPAGASAALILGRCMRRVLVIDAAEPRNAAAQAVHGFFGYDGIAPAELRELGRQQALRYRVDWCMPMGMQTRAEPILRLVYSRRQLTEIELQAYGILPCDALFF